MQNEYARNVLTSSSSEFIRAARENTLCLIDNKGTFKPAPSHHASLVSVFASVCGIDCKISLVPDPKFCLILHVVELAGLSHDMLCLN